MLDPTFEDGVIEYVREGGCGGEAAVTVYLLNKLPGIGGTIRTHEGVVTAVRAEHNPAPGSGHLMYLRHMLIKKLEDYFFRGDCNSNGQPYSEEISPTLFRLQKS